MSDSSMILAMKMVQVTSEAKASPIMTALTRMSADRNIDQGDSSRRPPVAVFSGLLAVSAAVVAAASEVPDASGLAATTGAAGGCATDAAGCDEAGDC